MAMWANDVRGFPTSPATFQQMMQAGNIAAAQPQPMPAAPGGMLAPMQPAGQPAAAPAAAAPAGGLAGIMSGLGNGMAGNGMALLLAGMGGLSGRDRASQWQGMMQGLQAGQQTDKARKKEEEDKKTEAQNKAAFAAISPFLPPQYAQAIKMGDTKTATQMLQFATEQQRADQAQRNNDRAFGLDRERLDLAKNKSETFEVGGNIIEKTPEGYKTVFQVPSKSGLSAQAAEREAEAVRLGLKPGDPRFETFVLTGKMPREDAQPLTQTDKKAILEADEMVFANEAAINALREAKKLSPAANSGWFAGARAAVGNNLPDWMVPDAVSSPQSSEATTNYDNAVVGQALTQLKTIFGGAPTEGERKILLELQGSANQPRAVREQILDRAIRAAEGRLAFNRDRAKNLRGGDFYKAPTAGQPAGQPADSTAPTATQAPDPLGIR